jgi:hypothetical protein
MDTIEVRGRRRDGPPRWFRLVFALRPKRTGPFVSYPPGFTCDFRAADDLAATYALPNWESAIVSGLGFALRRTPTRDWGVEVSVMEGEVAAQDMTGLAWAATMAGFRLHGQEPPAPAAGDWEFDVRRVTSAAPADPVSGAGTAVRPPASVS